MAETQPATSSWTSLAIRSEQAVGYCFGYGQAFMNGYFDDQRPMGQGVFGDFSKPEYNTQGLLVQLKIAVSLAARVERGTGTLVINDSPDWANHTSNLDGNARSWGQLIKHLGESEPMSTVTMNELQNGALNYDGSVAFFEKFKRIIILLAGSAWSPSNELCANLASAVSRGAPVVCIQADGYNANSNYTFNRIFQPLGLAVAGPNFTHLYAEAVTDYKSLLGDDLAWASISSLYGSSRKLFISGACAYTYSRTLPKVNLDGYPGSWAQGDCVEVPINDGVYIPNVVVFRPNCCYGEPDSYVMEFDVPATIVKPTAYQVPLANDVLHLDWWHELQTAEHVPEVLHVRARGWHGAGSNTANTPNAIRYRGQAWETKRSYNVMVFDRVSGDVMDFKTFDVFGNAAKAAECAAYLNAITSNFIVLVVTSDEPVANLSAQLIAALTRIGASASVLRRMHIRSAYMLVGIPDSGVGIERYAGDVDNSPNALVDAAFDFRPDGARPMETRMSTTASQSILATVQGIAERALFQSNWDAYQNQKAIDNPPTGAFNARFVKNVLNWIRRGTTAEVLFVPTLMATTGVWMPLNTGPDGCSSILDYIRAAGFNVSVLDHTKISNPSASAYAKYDAVVFWAAGGGVDDAARMSLLMPVLQTVVKGGAGLFAISDTAHPTLNSLAAMYSMKTNFVAGIQPASFDVERAKTMHGDHVIFAGLVGGFSNDSAAGGFLTQTRLLWPYCVDGESLNFIQLKENGRIARLRYTKVLDGMDNRHVFTLDAWTKLTDRRFKKIDMSDVDKWPLSIELPCVLADDFPRISINDIEVEEGDSGHTPATFTVTLETPLRGRPLIVPWRVIDGTATSVPGDTSKFPKGLMIDVDGNWASVYLRYDNVRIVADGGFPKFYNNSMVAGSWQRQYMKNALDFMQRGRAKRKVLFLGDQPNEAASYSTLGSDPTDFGIAVPASIQAAGYTVESATWQQFKAGSPTVADFLAFDSIVFICSTTSQGSAINSAYTNTLETAMRQGVGLFAITDHDVFTKSFVPLMARFAIRIYNDPSEQSMVDFAECRANLEHPELLAGIDVPNYKSPGSISAFIYDPAVASPPDIAPPFTGELVFDANESSQPITINVIGETLVENDEFFYVELYDPSRGELVKARGRCIITNDDGDLFNTRQLEKVVSWSGYIAGGDIPATPGANLFMIPVPAKWGYEDHACSVWISQNGVDVVEADRSGWSATYKFSVGRAASCRIFIMDDDSSNTEIFNSSGVKVFEWGSGGDSSRHEQALSLPAGEYTVVCHVHNDANGNGYDGNPGYLGISIRRV